MAEETLTTAEQKLIDDLAWDRNSKKLISISNPYSGQSCELDEQGVALYDFVKGCEVLGLNQKFSLGISLFAKLYPSQYYTLLD
jgi:hypothetical protein